MHAARRPEPSKPSRGRHRSATSTLDHRSTTTTSTAWWTRSTRSRTRRASRCHRARSTGQGQASGLVEEVDLVATDPRPCVRPHCCGAWLGWLMACEHAIFALEMRCLYALVLVAVGCAGAPTTRRYPSMVPRRAFLSCGRCCGRASTSRRGVVRRSISYVAVRSTASTWQRMHRGARPIHARGRLRCRAPASIARKSSSSSSAASAPTAPRVR
ncbi:MAG: hypothetical protein RLZZ450_1047 [Pseudomonadota bacterium]